MARRSREGAWIESDDRKYRRSKDFVAPVRERGLKGPMPVYGVPGLMVAPVRERGLKETDVHFAVDMPNVAPVRERGLKVYLIVICPANL